MDCIKRYVYLYVNIRCPFRLAVLTFFVFKYLFVFDSGRHILFSINMSCVSEHYIKDIIRCFLCNFPNYMRQMPSIEVIRNLYERE